jgi:hypothetical protein
MIPTSPAKLRRKSNPFSSVRYCICIGVQFF